MYLLPHLRQGEHVRGDLLLQGHPQHPILGLCSTIRSTSDTTGLSMREVHHRCLLHCFELSLTTVQYAS